MNQRLASLFWIFATATATTVDTVSVSMEETSAAASVTRDLQFGSNPDFFVPSLDLCDNNDTFGGREELGPCDTSKFPRCTGGSFICYNRKPSREHFYDDNHQPVFYIQYDRVYCYPEKWGACSSCTPGRYCKSESRCILEESGYPCAEWF